eukprot:COSAG01_NODE_586_length_15170_cov_32.511512_5_plen_48_part_00
MDTLAWGYGGFASLPAACLLLYLAAAAVRLYEYGVRPGRSPPRWHGS